MILTPNGQPAQIEEAVDKEPLTTEETVLLPLRHVAGIDGVSHVLIDAAAADHHRVIAPTHVMMRGDKIIGYLSLNGLPQVHAWFDSTVKNPRHSREMIKSGEVIFREMGVKNYCIACAAESPFTPHMERMGFEKLGTTVLWAKKL